MFKTTKFASSLMTVLTIAGMTVAPLVAAHADTAGTTSTKATVGLVPGDDGSGTGGSLSIDSAPNIDFGSANKLSSTAATLSATTVDNPLTVSDLRGTGAGWNVTVASSAFTTSDGAHSIQGAVIDLPDGTESSDGVATPPTPLAVSLTTDGVAQTVEVAAAQTGLGAWKDTFETNNVKLQVPGGQYADAYAANLTWTLADAPSK